MGLSRVAVGWWPGFGWVQVALLCVGPTRKPWVQAVGSVVGALGTQVVVSTVGGKRRGCRGDAGDGLCCVGRVDLVLQV